MKKSRLKKENKRLRKLLALAQIDMVDKCGECCSVCVGPASCDSDSDCDCCFEEECICKYCRHGSNFKWRFAKEI